MSAGGACSGNEMSEDTEHWFIEELVWGPSHDSLGQEVFLARVSGVGDFGQEVDSILWEQQSVDIPPKIVHAFLHCLSPDFPIGEQPAQDLLTEAYANAKLHLRNYEVAVDDSDEFSAS